MVGTVLNNTYRLERALMKGGMGQVFVASHLRVKGRLFAIKQLHPELAVAPNFQTRFEREAEVMMTLDHPNIVRIEDFLIEDNTYYLVMEFVEGDALDQKLQRERKLPPEECHRLTIELLEGLDYCHRKGVVHRDLKPSNLLLDRNNMLKLTDFGIALQESSDQRLTNTGTILGTPDYMSPEQIVGKELDGRSDIYAVGSILYEMLVGMPLYPRSDDDQGSYIVLFSHVHKPPPEIVDPNIPQYLRVVIERCLQKDPNNRFPTAREMALAMNDLKGQTQEQGAWPQAPSHRVSGGGPVAHGTAAFQREAQPLPSSESVSGVTEPDRREPRPPYTPSAHPPAPVAKKGGTLKWLFVLFLLVGGGGAGIWFFWPDGRAMMLSTYRSIVGEVSPANNNSGSAKYMPNPSRRAKAPDERRGSPAQRPEPVDAGEADTPPAAQDAGDPSDESDLSKPPVRRDGMGQGKPMGRTKPRAVEPPSQGDEPDAMKSPSRDKWPVTVSKLCAKLLAICVRRCLSTSAQPTLSFARRCRKNCWRTRIVSFKGQTVCPPKREGEP
ncbi:MAG: serine/threonine protein kinase [Deltaproteobacteria bacterium]|nr:MAG: serine/threonine protein kinase [Deltaproteobacteria bacterium]